MLQLHVKEIIIGKHKILWGLVYKLCHVVLAAQRPLYFIFVLTSGIISMLQNLKLLTIGPLDKFPCPQIYVSLIKMYLSTFFNNANQAKAVTSAT